MNIPPSVKKRAEIVSMVLSGALLALAGWDALGAPLRLVTLLGITAGAGALGVAIGRRFGARPRE